MQGGGSSMENYFAYEGTEKLALSIVVTITDIIYFIHHMVFDKRRAMQSKTNIIK